METPKLQKSSQISLKKWYASMRWFFRHIDTGVYSKNVTGRDTQGHVISSLQLKIHHYDWAKEENRIFEQVIKEYIDQFLTANSREHRKANVILMNITG